MEHAQPDRDRLDALAAAQGGLFTRTQALTCGYTGTRIRTKCRTDDWVTVVRDVYTDRGLRITPVLRDLAARLALPGAILVGPSAARLHRIVVPSSGTFVALPSRRVHLRHVEVLRETIPPADLLEIAGSPTTTLDRAIFDCVRVLPDGTAEALLTKALQECWTTMPALASRIRDATGRHGTPRLVRLVRKVAFGSRNASQQVLTRLLQRAGVWGWRLHEPIADRWGLIGLGDVVFPTARLVVDLGLSELEPEPEQAARCEERRTRLAAAGWTTVPMSWDDLTSRPTEVIADLRAHLDRLTPIRW